MIEKDISFRQLTEKKAVFTLILNKIYFKARFTTGDMVEYFIANILCLPTRNT